MWKCENSQQAVISNGVRRRRTKWEIWPNYQRANCYIL